MWGDFPSWKLCYMLFFISNDRLKFTKNQAKANQHPEAEHLLFENYSFSSSMLLSKNNRYSKKCTKNKYVCLNEFVWLMTMKIRLKMKNRSHRYSINRPRARHSYKYTNILIIKFDSWWLYVWSNTKATSEAQLKS